MRTAYFGSPVFLQHETGYGHPERPARLGAIVDALRSERYALWYRLDHQKPAPATAEQILRVHSRDHFDAVRRACERGEPLDADTPTSRGSWPAALLAAGAGGPATRVFVD